MPTYTFKNKDTDEPLFEVSLRISELDQFKADNPHLQQIITGAPSMARDAGNKKPDEGFRDVLKSIKKASGRGANINTF